MEFNVWPLLFAPIEEDGKFNTEKNATKYMTLVVVVVAVKTTILPVLHTIF
jgi:hypothetical protein